MSWEDSKRARHRQMPERQQEQFEIVTLAHIRQLGCRDLLGAAPVPILTIYLKAVRSMRSMRISPRRALVSAIRAVMTGIWRADAQDVITQDLNNCCKIT